MDQVARTGEHLARIVAMVPRIGPQEEINGRTRSLVKLEADPLEDAMRCGGEVPKVVIPNHRTWAEVAEEQQGSQITGGITRIKRKDLRGRILNLLAVEEDQEVTMATQDTTTNRRIITNRAHLVLVGHRRDNKEEEEVVLE